MKKTTIYTAVVAIAAIALFATCSQRPGSLEIGPDGYGKTTLANGITLLVNHDESTSLSAGRILIGGGVLTDNAGNNGLTNLTAKMLLKGNKTMTAAEITEKLDFLGANVSVDCFRDYSAVSFNSLTENFDQVLEIVSLSLAAPTFPAEELAKLKHETEGNIKAIDDNQGQASSKLFWKTAYGDAGYGLPTLGSVETMASVTVEDVRGHYESFVGGDNLIVAIATDLPPKDVVSLVQRRLGDIKHAADPVAVPDGKLQDEHEGFMSFERNQSFIFTGFMMDRQALPEVAKLSLLNEVMGNNVGSRLWFLRQKEKLAYAVYTQVIVDRYGTVFRAGIGTDTSKVTRALASLDREWNKLIDHGITSEELDDARINLKNNLIYRIDRKAGRANNMAYYEWVGDNYRYVLDLIDTADRIKLDEVNAFVKEQFTPDSKYVSIVGKK